MGNVLVIPESLWSFPDLLMKNGNLLALCALRCPHTMGSWGGSCSFSLVVGAFCTLGGCRRGEPSSRRHKIQHRLSSSVALRAPVPELSPKTPPRLAGSLRCHRSWGCCRRGGTRCLQQRAPWPLVLTGSKLGTWGGLVRCPCHQMVLPDSRCWPDRRTDSGQDLSRCSLPPAGAGAATPGTRFPSAAPVWGLLVAVMGGELSITLPRNSTWHLK